MYIKIVTGLSGAGKSQAIDSLEDMGYYCIDNMPPNLIKEFIKLFDVASESYEKLAFVMDLRLGKFFDDLSRILDQLKNMGYNVELIFIDASDEVLLKRFKETGRAHPQNSSDIIAGIKTERKRLQEIKDYANYYIDTSKLSIHELKSKMKNYFSMEKEGGFKVLIRSFGFKNGILADADYVFDVRFLPNPFYVAELKELTGMDDRVADYVMSFKDSKERLKRIYDSMSFFIPRIKEKGKSNVIIGIGCTGGKHRSVTLARKLSELLDRDGYNVETVHRDAQVVK